MPPRLGCPYGSHRSVEPRESLPQPAWRLDNTPDIYDNEILIDVETLNVDSASFTKIVGEVGGDPAAIGARIWAIVAERGKLHNPVTGSGGMLIGTVERVGSALADTCGLKPGDRIATLISLSLTPLKLEVIRSVRPETDQVDVVGKAVLFEKSLYAKLPADLPDKLSLAVLDVAGAPAQTAKLVGPGDTVLVLGGGGKSGLLCLHEAKKRVGVTGRVIALEYSATALERIQALGLADTVLQGDATKPLQVRQAVLEATGGELADVTLSNVNVPGAELSAILATKETGLIYYFSMATSFTAAALGAEGVGSDARMLIGNGYTKGHADIALQVLRENPRLRALFEELYA